jgi:hypothetical protein
MHVLNVFSMEAVTVENSDYTIEYMHKIRDMISRDVDTMLEVPKQLVGTLGTTPTWWRLRRAMSTISHQPFKP